MTKTTERIIRVRGCDECPYVYYERPKMVACLCVHREMTRRFSVTAFIKRGEIPQRCPLEWAK